MFTVKHVSPSGHEAVIEAREVRFQPRMTDPTGDTLPTLFIETPNGNVSEWTTGSFFVMNEKGATVSKYWLGRDCRPVHPETAAA